MNLIGRDRELAVVRQHLQSGKNLVIFGKEGVGKTALVRAAMAGMPEALYCGDTATLKTACESLLTQLGLAVSDAGNVIRKRAILQATAGKKRWFVFDHVGRVSPKLASFLDTVRESHSMVIVARSIAWADIGHLKMILWDFDRLELAPLSRERASDVLRAEMERLGVRALDREHFEAEVARMSRGNLHVLMDLCRQAVGGRYVFGGRVSTQLLDLDRRINELGLR